MGWRMADSSRDNRNIFLTNVIQQNNAIRVFVDGGVNISNEMIGDTDG